MLLRYSGNIESIRADLAPDCIWRINSQFVLAYRSATGIAASPLNKFRNALYPKCYALMDTSAITATGAITLREFPGLRLTGKDVLVGFIDTGIDYTNRLFQTYTGVTRIRAIWDQTIPSPAQNTSINSFPYGFGTEYEAEQINRALTSSAPYEIVPSVDTNGHGTYLASVASGTTFPEIPFTSMAPDSELLVVKLKPAKQNLRDFYGIPSTVDCFGEDDIILALQYLITKAFQLGKAIAICLGFGTNQGDHNNSTILEQYLSLLENNRGICIASAAGNELGYNGHFHANASAPTGVPTTQPKQIQTAIEINVNKSSGRAKTSPIDFSLEIWGQSPDLPRLAISSPSGEKNATIPYIRADSTTLSFLYEGTTVYIEISSTDIATGNPMYFVRFFNAAEGIWTLEVTHTQPIDAWLPVHSFLTDDIFFVRPDPDITITSPGNGSGTITVAGYNHTNDALYVNSSRGYTRFGRIKPDIAAPSVDVYGAFLAQLPLFTRRSGTSIGAAITAGAGALLLEWGYVNGSNPNISTRFIREFLIRGAKRPPNRIIPNRAYGFGILDLYNSFEQFRIRD
ncbi:MAG: S8 family peptidase [Lachnospiraceae bacterium]|nr:S8 family peptidase [Lachnospiraceae bacterium]